MAYIENKETLARRNKIDIGFRVTPNQLENIKGKAADKETTMNDLIRDTVTSQKLIVAGGAKLRHSIIAKLEALDPILENAIGGANLSADTQRDLDKIADIRNAWAS